jgi:protein-histidine pros-kinase
MKEKRGRSQQKKNDLRKHAEELLAEQVENLDDLSKTDIQHLIHELRAHQIELEMQNEELHKVQLELQELRDRYAELYDFAPVGYFTISEMGLILEVNFTGAALLGVERKDLIKKAFSRYISKEDHRAFYSYQKQLLRTRTKQTHELKMLKKDGTPFYAQLESTAVFDSEGNFGHFRVAMLDITGRRLAEEILRRAHGELEIKYQEKAVELLKAEETLIKERSSIVESLRKREEEYKNLFDNIPLGLYRMTPDGRILMANPALIRMLGCSSFEELASHNLENNEGFGPTYLRSQFKEIIEREGEIRGLESAWIKCDGTVIFVRENARVVREEGGGVLYYEGTVEDITERKKAEERFRLAVESAPNAIVMVDQRGKIVFVNSQTEKLFGYDRGELIGQSVEILVPERFRSKHSEYRGGFNANPQARPMGAGRDLFAQRKDGSEFPVEIGLNPIRTEEGVLVLSAIVDITERKRAEEALRESEESLKAIMNNTPDAILVYDKEGRIVTINKEAEKLFCGNGKRKLKSIWDIVSPENRASFSDKLKSVKEGSKLIDYETEKILENGKRIPVSVGLVYVNQGSGRFIETIRDIRERVILRNKIIELEKAQVVGKMAEGIAHHLGTPLASMLLKVQILKEDIPGASEKYEKVVEKLDSIEKQIFYAQKVIQRLLRFVRKPENEKLTERVSVLLEEAVEMVKPLLSKHGIKLRLSVDEDLKVLADGNLLQLVFSDIIMNAVDAMPEGGSISISASRGNPEGTVNIQISDTGTGISRDILPFVFEPFFSTKPAGKGTGLGLAVAKRVIHDHGGEISLDSVEGKGTSVCIKLPIYEEERKLA